jgi:hypothetical protein
MECTLLTLAIVGSKWSAFIPRQLYPWEKEPQYPLDKSWVNSRTGLDNTERRKILTLPGLNPTAIQPSAS